MKRCWKAAAALLAVFGVSWWLAGLAAGTTGSDEAAMEMVGQMAPVYEPWFAGAGLAPGPARQRLLFALQASAGGALFVPAFLWRATNSR